MISLILFCPRCKRDTCHLINPWQWDPGKYSALAVLCEECSEGNGRLEVFNLGEGMEIKV
jgi:hypothetical protein